MKITPRFDSNAIRRRFPSLNIQRNGKLPIFLDGPGGTQVPDSVIDAMVGYLTNCNANQGGVFATTCQSDQILEEARSAVADFLHARTPDEIVFGANMTTLTFHLSRSLGETWKAGDEILVTRLDHDANISPWILAARDAGATVHFVDVRTPDCTLDLGEYRRLLNPRTRLVAFGCASNAVGTLNDVRTLAALAHEHGARVFVDAVHYAPHGPIDVQAWDCDFLACSAYKFFGPHIGILWGRSELLRELSPYKVRPASESLPWRWMTGTQCHEGIAGTLAAIAYLASLDPEFDSAKAKPGSIVFRTCLERTMRTIQAYESTLARRLLAGLASLPAYQVWGIRDLERLSERVPTVAVTIPGRNASDLARFLADRHIYVWSGNMYALELSKKLGLEGQGGFVRLGLVHYNTEAEVDETLQALADFVRG